MKRFITLSLAVLVYFAAIAGGPCKATTVKGKPCRGIADSTGYCMAHTLNTLRCGAMTAKNQPCKNRVSKAGDKCRYHNH